MAPINVYFFPSLLLFATYRAKISPSRSQNRLGLFLLVLLQQAGKVRTGHICKNISQVDKNIWRYICTSLQSHRTFLRRFLLTQHHIFIDHGLSARDGQHSALFVSALASQQVFWYLSVFPLICRISWWAMGMAGRANKLYTCTITLIWSGVSVGTNVQTEQVVYGSLCLSIHKFHCNCLGLSNWLVVMLNDSGIVRVIISKWAPVTWKDN